MHWIDRLAVRRGIEAGIPWAVGPHPDEGVYNGYVRLPAYHGFALPDDVDAHVQVHGGLTYGIDEGGWIGFDTRHLGDVWPGVNDDEGERWWVAGIPTRVWSIDAVEAEARRLARQVADLMAAPREPRG